MSTSSLLSSSSSLNVRVKGPQRDQIEWRPLALDALLPHDHRARLVWQFVEPLDLGPLYAGICVTTHSPGRDAVDPRLLLALWLLATIEGIGSARQLARLCERDLAYQWLCGGVTVNYHLLADFRTQHAEFLETLLTRSVAALVHQQLVTLDRVAQDGMKVRASAGSSSFRRRPSLEKCLVEAQQHVARLRQESEQEASGGDGRRRAAQRRAAEERQARIARALEEVTEWENKPQKKGASERRCSTTDPEARRMKMADGGYRPAYNVQFVSDGGAQLIVAVDVTNRGNDFGLMDPLHQQVQTRYARTPHEYLVDGGFATQVDLTTLELRGTAVYAPIHAEKAMRARGTDPFRKHEGDNAAMVRFRQRMSTPEAKQIYRQRGAIAEFPNAECRNRGFTQLRVRGLAKAKAVALWYALAFNLMRMTTLGWLPATG